MNPFGNISSDSDQCVAPARLVTGHWLHPLYPHGDPVLCQVVIDLAEPRVVAAQAIENGIAHDMDSSALEALGQILIAQEVHYQPSMWGFTPCAMLPVWARPTFSESQIEELERIQGYLIEAPDDKVETVLKLRDAFLQGLGVTDRHMYRAVREPGHYLHKHGRFTVN